MKSKHITQIPFFLKALLVFSGSALLMLSMAGCASPDDENTDTEVTSDASPEIESTNTDEMEEKAEFEADVQSQLEDMRQEVDEMQQQLSAMGQSVGEEVRATVTGFNREMQEFATTFRDFQQSTDTDWESMKGNVTSGLEELKGSFEAMSNEVEDAYNTFMDSATTTPEATDDVLVTPGLTATPAALVE